MNIDRALDPQEQVDLIVLLNQHRERLPSVIAREAIALEQSEQLRTNSEAVLGDQGIVDCFSTSLKCADKRQLTRAKQIILSGDAELISLMDTKTIVTAYRKLHRSQQHTSLYTSLVKPSDNWNFSPIHYPRINNSSTVGYIPGDIYANCFWYFVKPGDHVVDPMAGSGMAQYVYEHRHEWMGNHIYDFHLALFDLTPQAAFIQQHNLLSGFPADHADYIFLDLPYLGMAKHAYSQKREDLANMHKRAYQRAVQRIAHVCAAVQTAGQLCTVISPNYTDHQKRKVTHMAEYIRECWRSAGYALYLETYASRRIQQSQSLAIARLNNLAKERRLPLTDMTLIMTFQRRDV